MGGEEKEKNITSPSGSNEQGEDDTSISRLLQDFNSADLFHSAPEMLKGANSCPESDCGTLASSLKHLHLRRPAVSKQKQSRVCLKKKTMSNTLNFAAGACGFQRPIVWPARLSGQSEKVNSHIVRPSRLSVNPKWSLEHETKPSVNACSSHVEKLSQGQKCIFGNASSVDYSGLSFSSLCEQATQDLQDRKNVKEDVCSSTQSHHTTVGPVKSVCKRQSSSDAPPAKFARTFAGDGESGTSPTVFLDYRIRNSTYSGDYSANAPSLVADGIIRQRPDSALCTHQAASMSSLETLAPLRSARTNCGQAMSQSSPDSLSPFSHEPRLDETNVNELASYFEDLLHIPRKMSIMAEMISLGNIGDITAVGSLVGNLLEHGKTPEMASKQEVCTRALHVLLQWWFQY